MQVLSKSESLVVILLICVAQLRADHQPSGFSDHTFKGFPGPSFFNAGILRTTLRPGVSGSKYADPQPKYAEPQPKYAEPQPKYAEPVPYAPYEQPLHNCTVVDETLLAEVCTPSFAPKCDTITVKGAKIGEKEKCVTITRTVCTQTTEEVMMDICSVQYEPVPRKAEATSAEISFKKECTKQMVTVCLPQHYPHTYGYGKDSYQHCKEIAQETCYNMPQITPLPVQVDVKIPEAKQDCKPQAVLLPTVECREATEEKCLQLPSVESADVDAELCTVEPGPPECKQVEIVLPKQVCQELVYGHAVKPHPPAPAPDQSYSVL